MPTRLAAVRSAIVRQLTGLSQDELKAVAALIRGFKADRIAPDRFDARTVVPAGDDPDEFDPPTVRLHAEIDDDGEVNIDTDAQDAAIEAAVTDETARHWAPLTVHEMTTEHWRRPVLAEGDYAEVVVKDLRGLMGERVQVIKRNARSDRVELSCVVLGRDGESTGRFVYLGEDDVRRMSR